MMRRLSLATAIVSTSSLYLGGLPPQTAALRGGALRLSSVAATDNPLLKFDGLPRFDEIDSSHVKPGVSETLATLEKQFAELEQTLSEKESPSYSDVVEAMEQIEDPVEYTWCVTSDERDARVLLLLPCLPACILSTLSVCVFSRSLVCCLARRGVVGHLMGVKNSDELRAAHGEMQGEVIKTTTKMSQSAAVFKALEVVAKDGSLDAAQKRIVEASLKGMRLSGVALEGQDKETFNKNRIELSELSTTFSNQLLDATKNFSLTLSVRVREGGGRGPAAVRARPRGVARSRGRRGGRDCRERPVEARA